MSKHPFNREYFCWDGKGEPIGYAGHYTDWPVNETFTRKIMAMKPKSVLEVGCGYGHIVKRLNDRGIRAVGMEISEFAVANRACDEVVLHDATEIPWPFKDKEFDLCVCVETMEHIPEQDTDKVLDEMDRVCERAWFGIAYEEIDKLLWGVHGKSDKTHLNIKPWDWWEEKFKKYNGRFRQHRKETEDMSLEIPRGSERTGLNLGCFVSMFLNSDKTKWINLDSLDLSGYAKSYGYNFQQHDMTKPLPFPSYAVKYIVANHLLEHLTREEGDALFKECFRVMETGGVIRVSAPDTKLLVKKYLEGTLNDYSLLNEKVERAHSESERLWEMLSANHRMFHDAESLSAILKKAGFIRVEQMEFNRSRDKEFMGEVYDTHPTHSVYFEAEKPSVVTGGGKLRIGLISTPMLKTPPRHYGGLEAVVADLAEELAKKNDVTVFAALGSKIPNVEVVETVGPFEDMHVDWLKAEMQAYEIYKYGLKEFDIINGHDWFGCEYLAKMADPSLKVCHTHHGGLAGWRTRPVEKMNMITTSDWMVKVCRSAGYEARRVYSGINLGRHPFKKEKGESLLFVGRIVPFKGPHIALEVADKLNMHIDFVGGLFPKLFPEYTEQFRSAMKSKDATLYPDAPHEVKVELMQNAKCLLFPSDMGEPFGLVPVEAGACGTPTIAWDDGAVKEVVDNGVTGVVVPKTVEAMADAVKKIDGIRPEDCRRRVEENFGRRVMGENYLALYGQIMSGDEW